MERIALRVEGMRCMKNCGTKAADALGTISGVACVRIDLAQKWVDVDAAAGVLTEDLIAALGSAGFDARPMSEKDKRDLNYDSSTLIHSGRFVVASPLPETPGASRSLPNVVLLVDDMMCMNNCGKTVANALGAVAGVRCVRVDLCQNWVDVELRAPVAAADLIDALESVGFDGREMTAKEAATLTRPSLTLLPAGRFAIGAEDATTKPTPTAAAVPRAIAVSQRVDLHVDGMMCMQNCGRTVANRLGSLPGVSLVRVDLRQQWVCVTAAAAASTRPLRAVDLVEALDAVGFDAREMTPVEVAALDACSSTLLAAGRFAEAPLAAAAAVPACAPSLVAATALLTLPPPSASAAAFASSSEAFPLPSPEVSEAADAPAATAAAALLRTATLRVGGMTCSSCVGAVERAVMAMNASAGRKKAGEGEPALRLPPIERVSVALLAGKAEVRYRPGVLAVSARAICAAVQAAGYECAVTHDAPVSATAVAASVGTRGGHRALPPAPLPVTATASLRVAGMTCASCVGSVERAARRVPGVRGCRVALLAGRAEVDFDPARTSAEAVRAAVQDAGYEAELLSSAAATTVARGGISPSARIITVDGNTDRGSGELGPVDEEAAADTATAVLALSFTMASASDGGSRGSEPLLLQPLAGAVAAAATRAEVALRAMPGVVSAAVVAASAAAPTAAVTTTEADSEPSCWRRSGTGASGAGADVATATVAYNVGSNARLRRVVDALEEAGWTARLVSHEGAGVAPPAGADTAMMQAGLARERSRWARLFAISALLAVPVLAINMVVPLTLGAGYTLAWGTVPGPLPGLWVRDLVVLALTAPIQLWLARGFYRGAWKGIVRGRCTLGMDFLVILGTSTAFAASLLQMALGVLAAMAAADAGADAGVIATVAPGTGTNATAAGMGTSGSAHGGMVGMPGMTFFETSALLLTFVMLGKLLETAAKAHTGDALSGLLSLQPAAAVLVVEDAAEAQWMRRRAARDAAAAAGGGRVEEAAAAILAEEEDGVVGGSRTPESPPRTSRVGGAAAVSVAATDTSAASDPAAAAVAASRLSTLPTRTIPLSLLSPGDLVRVAPGGAIPADGTVEAGAAAVDESMVTGEAMPVHKSPGSEVVGATVVTGSGGGLLYVRVARVGGDSVLSQIVRLVEEAQMSKAPIQAFADRASAVFAPAVLSAALLTFAAWLAATLTGGVDPQYIPAGQSPVLFSLLFGVAVVVVACPCALGLATPTAVMVGTGVGARHGVLIKGGAAFETAHRVTQLVFDKTGTLTEGRPTLTEFVVLPLAAAVGSGIRANSESLGGNGCSAALELQPQLLPLPVLMRAIASAEAGSEHPLGLAIRRGCEALARQCVRASDDGAALAAGGGKGELVSLLALHDSASDEGGEGDSSLLFCVPPESFEAVPGYGLACTVLLPAAIAAAASSSPAAALSARALPAADSTGGEGESGPLGATHRPPARAACPDTPSASSDLVESFAATASVPVRMLVGNRAWMATNEVVVPPAAEQQLLRLEGAGRTAVVAALGGRALAVLGVADRVKPEARAVVGALRALGVDVWLVTGDNARTAAAVGAAVGVSPARILAEVKPGGKAAKVRTLQATGACVAMVGDGINDAPALAAADVGMAIGAGAQIAVATADIVLVRSSLADIVTALHLSRAVFRRIRLNFIWALGYNALGVPLAAGLLFPATHEALAPEWAGLAMALSSVSVVLSSLALRLYTPPRVAEIARAAAASRRLRVARRAAATLLGGGFVGWLVRVGVLPLAWVRRACDAAARPDSATAPVSARRSATVTSAAVDEGDVELVTSSPRVLAAIQSSASSPPNDHSNISVATAHAVTTTIASTMPAGTEDINDENTPWDDEEADVAAAQRLLHPALAVGGCGQQRDLEQRVELVDMRALSPACGCSSPVCGSNKLERLADWERAWTAATAAATAAVTAIHVQSRDDGRPNLGDTGGSGQECSARLSASTCSCECCHQGGGGVTCCARP